MPTFRFSMVSRCLFAVSFVFSFGLASAQVSLTDDLQRRVTLTRPPERIISLSPGITETLFAIGAGDLVAGVTDYCNHPVEAARKPRVGGILNPSIETIIALKPDLILLSMVGNIREDMAKLEELGVPVFVTNPGTLEGIYKSVTDIGMLTGRDAGAETLVHRMRSVERSIAGSMPALTQRRVLLLVSVQPLIVVGGGTFISQLLELAGGVNIAHRATASYPTYSREAVIKENPDVIILTDDLAPDTPALLALFPEWRDLHAVRTGAVHRINADILSRPGPRTTEALQLLFNLIHQ